MLLWKPNSPEGQKGSEHFMHLNRAGQGKEDASRAHPREKTAGGVQTGKRVVCVETSGLTFNPQI